MAQLYRVAEFARLAGVTVRTLQYYDREELLKPSDVSESGYRLYRLDDLIPLAQILTLKWMGFRLAQIKEMLSSPRYNLARSLALQKAAVDAQIAELQAASDALSRLIDEIDETDGHPVDAAALGVIIHSVTGGGKGDWVRRYYSDAAWAGIQSRRLAFSTADLEQVQREWESVFAGFAEHRHEAPDSPSLQVLAARMDTLLEAFTGGNPEIESGLRRFVDDAQRGEIPTDMQPYNPYAKVDDDLRQLMQDALNLYQAHKSQKRRPT
ncbi:MerR family transcriptional regulator [bacterium]|nr:MerR family transcriptional regulator [bacterium]